jgi:hypothetical protein
VHTLFQLEKWTEEFLKYFLSVGMLASAEHSDKKSVMATRVKEYWQMAFKRKHLPTDTE